MSLRETLRNRPDVPNEDIDDSIEIAARRQDEQRAHAEGHATVEEVEKVAAELDIAPEHVEAALGELKARRAAATAQEAEQKRQWQRLAGRLGAVLLGTVGLVASLGVVVGVLAWVGAQDVSSARAEALTAEGRVTAAIERQASLAPQLAGLAGASGGELSALQAAVREAPDLSARLAAADALSAAMAARLGALPPAESAAEQTLRVQLTDEISGSQNRVGVELGRYREAEARWRLEAESSLGSLGVGLGLAEAPQR